MINSRPVVYTCMFGGYDCVSAVNSRDWPCDFICFTDRPDLVSSGWQVILVENHSEAPHIVSRRYKMLAHQYLPQYEYSLYIDSNIRLHADPSPLFARYLANANIAIAKHPERDCAYQELQECTLLGLVDVHTAHAQAQRYLQLGFPQHFGLNESGVIIRRHHAPDIVELMTHWQAEFLNGGKRDQFSFNYLVWKLNVHTSELNVGPRYSRRYFSIKFHTKQHAMPLLQKLEFYFNIRKTLGPHYALAYRCFRWLHVQQLKWQTREH